MAEVEHDRKQQEFSYFKMPDGKVHRIRNCFIIDFAREAFMGEEPLSKGANILLNCVSCSADAGRLTELLHMIKKDSDGAND